jgi:hypothetical protein
MGAKGVCATRDIKAVTQARGARGLDLNAWVCLWVATSAVTQPFGPTHVSQKTGG